MLKIKKTIKLTSAITKKQNNLNHYDLVFRTALLLRF